MNEKVLAKRHLALLVPLDAQEILLLGGQSRTETLDDLCVYESVTHSVLKSSFKAPFPLSCPLNQCQVDRRGDIIALVVHQANLLLVRFTPKHENLLTLRNFGKFF